MNLTNAAIFGNMATGNGGGGGIFNSGTVNVINSTIAANSTNGSGGGIDNASGTVSARNTIIAKNTATTGGPDFFNTLTLQDFNLIGSPSGAFLWHVGRANLIGRECGRDGSGARHPSPVDNSAIANANDPDANGRRHWRV